jgi:hypothetical protein
MPSKDDESQAKTLADKIVRDGERGATPSGNDVEALAALVEPRFQKAADALRLLQQQG